MSASKVASLFFAFILIGPVGFAQKSRDQIEQEKKENLQKIAETEKVLSETSSRRTATLGQLSALNVQIEARGALIASIKREIGLLDDEIEETGFIITSLQEDLSNLETEYAAMIYAASKTRYGVNRITFLFAAKTFNQFLMRLKYLEQYAQVRKTQIDQIRKVKLALEEQNLSVLSKKEKQNELLTAQISENEKLLKLKVQQDNLVKELSKKEGQLKAELNKRRQSIRQLDRLLAQIVKSNTATKAPKAVLAKEAELSEGFEGQRQKLTWPVQTGFVSSRFGRHPHPVLKGIMVENQGIDIQTNSKEKVKAVYDGKVATVAFVPGMNSVVIVQHGDYYTLYAKLRTANVKRGQVVKADEVIGEVYTDGEGMSEVQFQVWKKNRKLDPEKWLYRK